MSTKRKHKLLLAFYGDDFTGSTDALEFLSTAGAKTVLFINPPTPEQLNRYDDLDAVGMAGISRSMSPAEMETELTSAFTSLKLLNAAHIHYKVCSTFDSSPAVGSIGKAIDIGSKLFPSDFVPVLVAAPILGRYTVFGNLFARMGIGSKNEIFRLDRHPSMSKHPITPSDESDLRLHLSKQTTKKIGLVDILKVSIDDAVISDSVNNLINDGAEIILFDGLDDMDLYNIGCFLGLDPKPDKSLFSVGSSGIEMALGSYWNVAEMLTEKTEWRFPGISEPLLVVSGSCSPVTSGQITWALKNGFTGLHLQTSNIAGTDRDVSLKELISSAIQEINAGKSVIVYTSLGNTDIIENSAKLLGSALGEIARSIAQQTSVKRIVIAGGDTSSYAARSMGIEAVEMIAPLSPGAPLCKAYAPGSAIDGLEVNFKGGQVGREDYFGMVLQGVFKQ